MLQFLFGLPGSGKSFVIIEKLKEITESGGEAVLLIPEQFSFESERRVLKTLGDHDAQHVAVMSFTRLCDEVGRIAGGISGITLSGADKVIFMSRALLAVSDELILWGKYCRSVSFAKTMLDTVGEMKINAISPGQLQAAVEQADTPALQNKLHDIALIYQAYDSLLGEKFFDPADRLTKLYRQLETARFFEGKDVFFDSFKSFTGQQYKIIERILAQSKSLTVSLTNDCTVDRDYDIFTNIRKTVDKIRTVAARYDVNEAEPNFLDKPYLQNPAITAVSRLIAGIDAAPLPTDTENVTIIKAKTVFDEAEFAVRTVRKLVRENGYRYRDFVLIARDIARYEDSVSFYCRQNGIPCFSDKRLPLASFPLPVAALFAVKTAVSPDSESIFRFLKTGLGTLDEQEVSRLENYVTLWNIDGELWKKEWTMDPRGLVKSETPVDEAELTELNDLRKRATEPLFAFRKAFSGRASDMAAALVRLFEKLDVADKLAALAQDYAQDSEAVGFDELRQSYELLMRLLDSIARCYGETDVSKQEFYAALKLSIESETVGVVPRMLDEVTFGSADRIRPSRPKIAFLLGANRGIFPKTVSQSGMFRAKERSKLNEIGIELPDHVLDDAVDEEFLVYCTASCPSDRLYILYAETGAKGEGLETADFVALIRDSLSLKEHSEPQSVLTPDNIPETAAAVYSEYCTRHATPYAKELREALKGREEAHKAEHLERVLSDNKGTLSKQAAGALFGTSFKLSPSKVEKYHSCPFSYFCNYGLHANRLEPAEFSARQRGTIVHYVLERLISSYKKDLSTLEPQTIGELVREYTEEYLDSVEGYRETENARSRFLVDRIVRMVHEVACNIAAEFAQSDFEPVACELKIDSPPICFTFDGGKITLDGTIDRVDSYNGYLRVVDYKTNSKEFRLPDTLFGLNLQMLVYLYAVTRGSGLPDEKAAGILYLPVRRDTDKSGMAMNGLLQNNTELVSAMDKGMGGKFVPKYDRKINGELKKNCKSFITTDEITVIFDYLERIMKESGERITEGDIRVLPMDGVKSVACTYCDYRAVCGIEEKEHSKVPDMSNRDVFEKMGEGKQDEV